MDKQKKILESSLKLFVEYGFHGTPTSRIAKEAGVANGTLFHYYRTKNDLIVALYSYVKIQLSDYLFNFNTDHLPLKQKLKRIYSNALEWAKQNPQEFYFMQQFNTSPYLSLISQDQVNLHSKPYIDIIEEGIQQGKLKNISHELLFLLMNNHISAVNQYLTKETFAIQEREDITDNTFELLWLMISTESNL